MKTLFNTSFFSNLWMENKEFHSYPLNSKEWERIEITTKNDYMDLNKFMFWLFLCELKLLTSFSFLTLTLSYSLLTRSNEFFEWVELKLHQIIHPFFDIIVFSKIFLISFWESLLLLIHLKMIYSNVRDYWVFIQKHFIPLFEVKAMEDG